MENDNENECFRINLYKNSTYVFSVRLEQCSLPSAFKAITEISHDNNNTDIERTIYS